MDDTHRTSHSTSRIRFTKAALARIPAPAKGRTYVTDTLQPKLRIAMTPAGTRTFQVYCWHSGAPRTVTLARFEPDTPGTMTIEQARKACERELSDLRARGPKSRVTVGKLASEYLTDHAAGKRASSRKADERMIQRFIRPRLGHRKVADVKRRDIEKLHRALAETPYMANRLLALISKMFSLAVAWEYRADNPCRGIARFSEDKRERYLKPDEIKRLAAVLDRRPGDPAASVIRLCLLTGARVGEVLAARWDQFSDDLNVWTKPSSHTKQKKIHRVPMSAPARALLAALPREEGAVHVFPSEAADGHITTIDTAWRTIRKAAEIEDVRIHDLRHSYASILASSGASLPLIGALLGHTQPGTTARYAHLRDEPLKEAAERVGAIVSGQPKADVVSLATKG